MYKKILKRIVDFGLALVGLLLLLPVFLTVWFLLTIYNKGAGAFFTQPRPGYKGEIFKVIKFKTMTDEKDNLGNLLPDEKRLTKVGKFVRSTSLDEIPQLINVLKGDMSLIGPRPLLVDYLPLYSKKHAKRHLVRPGITGWAQVNGRNLLKLSQKFDFDVWYVENLSLQLDSKILFLTIKKVFAREGIGTGSMNMKDVDDLGFKERMKK